MSYVTISSYVVPTSYDLFFPSLLPKVKLDPQSVKISVKSGQSNNTRKVSRIRFIRIVKEIVDRRKLPDAKTLY